MDLDIADEKQSLFDASRKKEERMEGEIERAIADTTTARAEVRFYHILSRKNCIVHEFFRKSELK